jgi:uncharacterized protein involved in exopolysaccharide biosynthesis
MNHIENADKISITALLRVIYKSKRTVLLFIAVFVVLGVCIYLLSPKEYSSQAVLMPENIGSNQGISGLASLAGINVGRLENRERNLSSTVYEPIIRSNSFLNKIINIEYEFPSIGQRITLKDYFLYHSEPSIGDRVGNFLTFNWIRMRRSPSPTIDNRDSVNIDKNSPIFANSILKVSSKKALKDLNDRLYYSKDVHTGLITISLDLQDAEAGAKVLQKVIAELILITKDYQGQKDSINLSQVEAQLIDKKAEYERALESHARFLDQNINLIRSMDRLTEQKLQNEISFAFNVYNTLLQQREQISIQSKSLQDPIAIIEPIQIAGSPYRPRIFPVMVLCIFFGILFGTIFVLLRKSVINIID